MVGERREGYSTQRELDRWVTNQAHKRSSSLGFFLPNAVDVTSRLPAVPNVTALLPCAEIFPMPPLPAEEAPAGALSAAVMVPTSSLGGLDAVVAASLAWCDPKSCVSTCSLGWAPVVLSGAMRYWNLVGAHAATATFAVALLHSMLLSPLSSLKPTVTHDPALLNCTPPATPSTDASPAANVER